MTRFFSQLLILAALIVVPAYVAAQDLSEPEKNFEHLWKTYDRNYALFGAKHIDWDALYKVYRPRVTSKTTDDELFQIISDLLGNLNDNHVRLSSSKRRFQSGILGQMKMEDFSLDLVKQKYLKGKSKPLVDGVFDYGWLTDSIGYFHFRGFGRLEQSEAAVDSIIKDFKDAKAIVVDVRGNGGGDDRVGKLIADRFADQKRLYMKTAIRSGSRHGDFTPWKYWYVEPGGPLQFTKPVILLTHRFSVSAAENFALAMRVLPHVTVVGDATSGVFADVYGDRMPNGWGFSVSFKLFIDYTGFCWEGIGVPADIRETNAKQDIEQQRDKVLDLAVSLIETGGLKPQDEAASLKDIRQSLAKNLARDINEKGLDAALKAFRKAKAGPPSSYYFDLEELMAAADRLWKSGKKSEAVEAFKIGVAEAPWSHEVHELLGDAYFSLGETALASPMYKKASELNRRSYPWEVASYEDAVRLSKGIKLPAKGLARDIDDNKGIDAALKAFDQAKSGGPGTYFIDEGKINQLGYQLLNRGRTAEAIEVFKLNAREFPKSANVYDSLGEAYLKTDNKELAIQNYKRAAELNPTNTNAIDIVKRLSAGAEGVDTKVFGDYKGRYDSPLGIITVTLDEGKLFAQPEGSSKEELIAKSSTKFQVSSVGAEVEFVRDEQGQVAKMLIRMSGQQLEAKRIK
ncbi:MAG TPA: S41 family peptidase [Blastocatellia bacterium]|nr:S41 family peptidase [Blastocatellia bacterium]